MGEDEVLRDQFIEGLVDPALRRELRSRVRGEPGVTFGQAKEVAIFWGEDSGGTQAVAAVVQVAKDKRVDGQAGRKLSRKLWDKFGMRLCWD